MAVSADKMQHAEKTRSVPNDPRSISAHDAPGQSWQVAVRRPAALAIARPPLAAESIACNVTQPRIGLDFPRQMSFGNWLDIGIQLSAFASSSAWCLGDWLIYGETYYSGRYRDAIERTSLDYKTLRNYAWVARRFSRTRRYEGLSFGHHAEVAARPEPEQSFWLRKARTLGWTRNELRKQVRASLKERGGEHSAIEATALTGQHAEDILPMRMSIGVTARQLDVIQHAAVKAELSAEVWAAQTLEKAARCILADDQPALVAGGTRQTE